MVTLQITVSWHLPVTSDRWSLIRGPSDRCYPPSYYDPVSLILWKPVKLPGAHTNLAVGVIVGAMPYAAYVIVRACVPAFILGILLGTVEMWVWF